MQLLQYTIWFFLGMFLRHIMQFAFCRKKKKKKRKPKFEHEYVGNNFYPLCMVHNKLKPHAVLDTLYKRIYNEWKIVTTISIFPLTTFLNSTWPFWATHRHIYTLFQTRSVVRDFIVIKNWYFKILDFNNNNKETNKQIVYMVYQVWNHF